MEYDIPAEPKGNCRNSQAKGPIPDGTLESDTSPTKQLHSAYEEGRNLSGKPTEAY